MPVECIPLVQEVVSEASSWLIAITMAAILLMIGLGFEEKRDRDAKK